MYNYVVKNIVFIRIPSLKLFSHFNIKRHLSLDSTFYKDKYVNNYCTSLFVPVNANFIQFTQVRLHSAIGKAGELCNPVTEDTTTALSCHVSQNDYSLEEIAANVKLELSERKKYTVFDVINNPEIFDDIAPYLPTTYNLAVHVNKSPCLKELVKLGVNIGSFDADPEKARFILTLRFEEDIKPHLLFLHQLGVPADCWGKIFTVNPFLLKEDLALLQTRVKYLQSKSFTPDSIVKIISSYPKWLSHRVETLDSRLGLIQQLFTLSGDEVRSVATAAPRFVFYNDMKIRKNIVIIGEDYEFSKKQVKELLVQNPQIYQINSEDLSLKLHLVLDKMALSRECVVRHNKLLTCRRHRLDSRHFFLKSLGRTQYDPCLPRYVCPSLLATHSDAEFAILLANSSIHAYHLFLKTQ